MNLIDAIGSVAAVLTTLSFVPQAIKTFKTRDQSANHGATNANQPPTR